MKFLFGLLRRGTSRFTAHAAKVGAGMVAIANRLAGLIYSVTMTSTYTFQHHGPDGVLIDEWVEKNIVVNTGLDLILDVFVNSAAYTASHFVGITDGTPTTAATDTAASHAGWVEVVAYTEAARPAFTPGAVAAQSVDNSAAKAVFSINVNATTIGGGFLGTDSGKGGVAGTLYGVAAFSAGNKLLDSGDTLSVTVQLTAS